jgi:DNA gyrase subunit A
MQIKELLDILGDRNRVLTIMRDEMIAVRDQFKSPRRTSIEEGDSSVEMEDLIQREEMVVTVSMEGYIKRVPLAYVPGPTSGR